MNNFKLQEFMDSLSAEAQERVRACKTTEELRAIVEAENIDITAFMDDEDRELSLDDLELVDGGKGGLIAGTLAAALAAITFASCGGMDGTTILPRSARANVSQAVTTVVREEPAVTEAAPAAEEAAEKTAAEKTEKTEKTSKKENKKSDKKKKSSKKSEAKKTETEAETKKAQPVILPTTYAPVHVENDAYAGTFVCRNDGRALIDVTNIGNNYYAVHITWVVTNAENNSWDFIGQFDGRATMNYANCIKNNHVISGGADNISTVYADGTGSIRFENGSIIWNDAKGEIRANTIFDNVRPQPAAQPKQQTETKKTEEAANTDDSNLGYYEQQARELRKRVVVLHEDDSKDTSNESRTTETDTVYGQDDVIEVTDPDQTAEKKFWTGSFYEANGGRVSLEITKSKVIKGTYDCVVTAANSDGDLGEYLIWGFNAVFDNDMLVYNSGAKSIQEFNDDGKVIRNEILNEGHFGNITYSGAAGLRWMDNDGTTYIFTKGIL